MKKFLAIVLMSSLPLFGAADSTPRPLIAIEGPQGVVNYVKTPTKSSPRLPVIIEGLQRGVNCGPRFRSDSPASPINKLLFYCKVYGRAIAFKSEDIKTTDDLRARLSGVLRQELSLLSLTRFEIMDLISFAFGATVFTTLEEMVAFLDEVPLPDEDALIIEVSV